MEGKTMTKNYSIYEWKIVEKMTKKLADHRAKRWGQKLNSQIERQKESAEEARRYYQMMMEERNEEVVED